MSKPTSTESDAAERLNTFMTKRSATMADISLFVMKACLKALLRGCPKNGPTATCRRIYQGWQRHMPSGWPETTPSLTATSSMVVSLRLVTEGQRGDPGFKRLRGCRADVSPGRRGFDGS